MNRAFGRRFQLAVLLLLLASPAAAVEPAADSSADLTAARKVFEANLEAIRRKDKDAYLACYLPEESFARTGPDGMAVGFAEFAAGVGTGWPDKIEAEDIHLTPVRPGLVYGTYRYRVRYGTVEQSGLSERVFLATPAGWKIAISTAFQALPGVPPPPKALVGATLIDGTGAASIADSVVVLREGKIDCAGSRAACPVPSGVDVLDVKGQWLTPGLIDAHVHFSQTGWADARPDALDVRDRHTYAETIADLAAHPERFYRSQLCSGVTSVFDVGGFPWTLDLSAKAEDDTLAPHVVAAGPLLTTIDHWLNLPAERQMIFLKDADAAREGVRWLAARGSRAVKIWFIVAEEERPFDEMAAVVRAAAEEAAAKKLPLIVHATGLKEAKEALRDGVAVLVHSVTDLPVDEEFLRLAKEKNVIYIPTLTVGAGYQRMFEGALAGKAPEIDDPNHCVDPVTRARVAETAKVAPGRTAEQIRVRGERNAARERIGAENLTKVAAAGITIAMGTDAGNPLTLHGPSIYAEMEAMQAAGMTPNDVLISATRGGARALGRSAEIGTIEKGKLADLLIVGADPAAAIRNLRQVRYVVRGGVIRPIAELSALATTAP
ncbi:MAG TPA: amidohydrolase family protein [Thermoanaerobaculia bacterium]|jgi:imidazolonepropionase-like amidohydrolase|nr:amidohydrolase family protein [Thermoanaerobaculia bacterium]